MWKQTVIKDCYQWSKKYLPGPLATASLWYWMWSWWSWCQCHSGYASDDDAVKHLRRWLHVVLTARHLLLAALLCCIRVPFQKVSPHDLFRCKLCTSCQTMSHKPLNHSKSAFRSCWAQEWHWWSYQKPAVIRSTISSGLSAQLGPWRCITHVPLSLLKRYSKPQCFQKQLRLVATTKKQCLHCSVHLIMTPHSMD